MTRLLAILLLLPAIASAAGLGVYNPAQHAVNGFMPTQLGDCAMWFDAGRACYTNDTTVSNWDDFSGNGRNVTNATSSKCPTYRTSSAAGRPALYFDGTDDFLSRNSVTPVLNQQITVFHAGLLIYQQTANAYAPYIFDADTNVSRVAFSINWDGNINGTNQIAIAAGTGIQTSNRITSSTWYSYAAVYNRSNSYAKINGEKWNLKTATDIGTNTIRSIRLGGRVVVLSSQDIYLGNYSELIVYNKMLTDEQIIQVERYLGTKYGIVVQ